MLRVFRENLRYLSWVLWLVIAVFVLLAFTDFGSMPQGGGTGNNTAATVGGYEITYGEFEQAYRQQEAQIQQMYGQQIDPEMARQLGLYNQVIESLITEKVLLSEADRMGVHVSDKEVRDSILEFPVFKDDNGNFIGEDAYVRLLRDNRMSPDAFEESIRQSMVTSRVRSILNQNIYISDSEIESSYRDQAERAKIRFISLDGAEFADQVTLDDTTVAAYFEEHKEDFEIPEKRTADYLLIDWAQLQSEVSISDEEVNAYYTTNQTDYSSDEQVQARHILVRAGADRSVEEATRIIEEARARIERGEDFADVAGELSDDPGSKERGGDLGSFGRGQMVPPFEEAAFGASVGDIVGPVETNFGVHLIEVLNKIEGGLQPVDQVAPGIRNRLTAERARALADTKAQELSDRVTREGLTGADDLRAIADAETGVTFLSTDAFGENDTVTGIGRGTAFTTSVFRSESGEVSEAIQIPRGWAIVRLDEVEEARLPELSEVDADVRTAVRATRQVELASEALAKGREQLQTGASLDDLAETLGAKVEESAEFGRTDAVGSLGSNQVVSRAALSMNEGSVSEPIGTANGAVLFEVVERKRFEASEFEASKEATRGQLVNQRASEMLTALVSARRDELGVEFDPTFVENFQTVGS